VLKRIFGPVRKELTGRWRKLYSEELHMLYSLPNTIRVIQTKEDKLVATCTMCGEDEKCVQNYGQKA
jgi:hypothetical protein